MSDLSNALIAGAIEGLKEVAKDVVKGATALGRKQIAKLAVDFEFGFKDFLDRNYKRLSRVKTLLNPTQPVSIEATYVPPNLSLGDTAYSERQFIAFMKENNFIVVTGIGGSGKSIFLKHLFVLHCKEALGRVPLFVELRNLSPEVLLLDYMAHQVSTVAPLIDNELFRYALKSGKFILLLDGFDEIDPSFRDAVARQILELSYEFGDNVIVVTSRPDGPFSSWTEFFIAKMEPFNKKQVTSLISKMEYDSDTKKEFLKLVKQSLFDTHKEYLSNPLLCTLMLLTFDQGAEIPSKMHVFFERTFDVLFYKHDATKEASFRRKFATKIAVDDFRQAFAAFSAFSYLDYGSSFKHAQAIDCAHRALEYNEISDDAGAFVSDLSTSVSILIREGDSYNYIHRSFQEFFVAQFLSYRQIDDWESLIVYLLVEKPNDSVVRLMREINRDRFERQFLAPRMAEIRKELEQIDIKENPSAAFGLFYLNFEFDGQRVVAWIVGMASRRPKWHFMVQFFDNIEDLNKARLSLDTFEWANHFDEIGAPLAVAGDELIEIFDSSLMGTPMVAYLEALKSAVIVTDNRLRETAAIQRRLVSTAFLRRESGTTLSNVSSANDTDN